MGHVGRLWDLDMSHLMDTISEEVITTGAYRELSTLLSQRLETTDWESQVRDLVTKTLSEDTSRVNFKRVLALTETQAVGE